MSNIKQSQINPFVIAIVSIISLLLACSGVERLIHNDLIVGLPQVIVGFVGGILGF